MPTYRPPKIALLGDHAARDLCAPRNSSARSAWRHGALQRRQGECCGLSAVESKYKVDEKPTPIKDVTTYNNFYEFGPTRTIRPALAGDFKPRPGRSRSTAWSTSRHASTSRTLIEAVPARGAHLSHALRRGAGRWSSLGSAFRWRAAQEGRAARQRQVRRLRDAAAARGDAGAERLLAVLDWPYVEGLRLDEAMHPLTLLAVGLYGETLPNQNGAPMRLVVPWKYGFKGIKSIVQIARRAAAADHLEQARTAGVRLLRQRQPGCRPSALEPGHRAAHRRKVSSAQAATHPAFNGYADQVASLYDGMDLKANF